MKTLIIIWGLVAIAGTVVTVYIVSVISDATLTPTATASTHQTMKVSDHPTNAKYNYNPQQTIDGTQLQGGF
jgi:hypothetical protein